jgi:hypothetical protein
MLDPTRLTDTILAQYGKRTKSKPGENQQLHNDGRSSRSKLGKHGEVLWLPISRFLVVGRRPLRLRVTGPCIIFRSAIRFASSRSFQLQFFTVSTDAIAANTHDCSLCWPRRSQSTA